MDWQEQSSQRSLAERLAVGGVDALINTIVFLYRLRVTVEELPQRIKELTVRAQREADQKLQKTIFPDD